MNTMLQRTCVVIIAILLGTASADILWKDVCTQSDTKDLPFCDVSLPREARVKDYVKRVDLSSKSKMMENGAQSFDKLHIPRYQWWSEGLHGALQPCVCDKNDVCKCPTSFPCPSAMAAAFNNTLYNLMGNAIGLEARAINNLRNRDKQVGDGIDYWSPTINMQRDPRWGRNQEVPGEDPMLTGQYAVNFVRGLQEGEDPDHVQIVACCKHFIANSLEQWKGVSRHNFDAPVSKADLFNYYMPPFRACVMEGRSLGIMCSYNSINGIPACANKWLLNTTLRETWGFQGYVTSDCGAIADISRPPPNGHGYTQDRTNATAVSVAAGTDVNCGRLYSNAIPDAVKKKLLTKQEVDRSFSRLVDIQMRLGLFDNNKAAQPYFNYGSDEIDTAAHQALALEAAQQSIVLLKNEGGVLPLKIGRKVAVIGPHFNSTKTFLSNYHGARCPRSIGTNDGSLSCIQTPLAAIKAANVGGKTTGSLGCQVNSTEDYIAAAVAAASTADEIVLMLGIDNSIESEGLDRISTTLPGLQIQLATAILSLKKPTVLVLVSGGTISLGTVLKETAPAIVSAVYGGERAAEAIADVLFGTYNPSGKLAATMYPPEYVDEIPLTEMGLQVPPGRTHMFYTGNAEFAFGHGLSYTAWGLVWGKEVPEPTHLHTTNIGQQVLNFEVKVSNVGNLAGRQTVLLFMVPEIAEEGSRNGMVPLRQKLLAYSSAEYVLPGEHQNLRFQVSTSQMAIADKDGNMVITAMKANIVFRDGQNELCHPIVIQGAPITVDSFPGTTNFASSIS